MYLHLLHAVYLHVLEAIRWHLQITSLSIVLWLNILIVLSAGHWFLSFYTNHYDFQQTTLREISQIYNQIHSNKQAKRFVTNTTQ